MGRGAKRFIDDRGLLEAKRVLVHTNQSAASIGQQLGFPAATEFAKFFRQRTGQTPTSFRARDLVQPAALIRQAVTRVVDNHVTVVHHQLDVTDGRDVPHRVSGHDQQIG
jgi:AraC-like DNA-binding protein